MGGQAAPLSGPDFSQGFRLSDIKDGSMLLGQAFGEAVLLIRRGGQAFALSAFCTHYGGPLAEGILTGETIRCPWHHACFDLKSGAPVSPPALNALTTWKIEREGELIFVRGKTESSSAKVNVTAPETFVIVGAGAAGLVAAETLRHEGFTGRILLIGEDPDLPYDRPNISKDYLAGNAPEEWIPLRGPKDYAELAIEVRPSTKVTVLEPKKREIQLSSGETVTFDKLLLATGASPLRLPIPGADLAHVHTLRTLADSRAIIEKTKHAKKAVVIGTGFIGLETAASLRARGLEVSVVGKANLPLEVPLGPELGGFVKIVHESNGVAFHLNAGPTEIRKGEVLLENGTRLEADLVIMGVGVLPSTELAEAAGLKVEKGVLVDHHLETSCPGIFAAGDVARYPDPISGEKIRVEHWVHAQRQAKVAALNMMGKGVPFEGVPFFWSNHYDLSIGFTGYAPPGSERVIAGSLEKRSCVVAYRKDGKFSAVATIGRDQEALMVEEALERGDTRIIGRVIEKILEKILQPPSMLTEIGMHESPIQDVSDTAFMVAAYRAIETQRSNALFRDPLAERLAGDHGKKILANLPNKRAFLGGWSIAIRTCIIDSFIQEAIAEGVDTVFNLGAGLDTRPYRMDLPATLRWIEIDYPHVIELKDKRLSEEKPRCRLERIKLDLADEPVRRKVLEEITSGSKKALVLTEGVIPYLYEDSVASLGRDLRAMNAIQYWIADYFSPASYRYRRRSGMTRNMKNAPFVFEPKDYFSFFAGIGWKPKEVRYFAEEGERLRRPAPFPLTTKLMMQLFRLFASPEVRREMRRFAGYVLFERDPGTAS